MQDNPRASAEAAASFSPEMAGFFTALLEHTPAPIFVCARDFRYLLVNRAWEQLFQKSRQEVLGRKIEEVIPPDIAPQFIAGIQRILDSGVPSSEEEWLDAWDGRHFYKTVAFPLKNAAGLVEAVGGIAIDMTDRRGAEEALRSSEERYRHFFEDDLAGAFISRPDGLIRDCNPSFARLLGFDSVDEVKRLTATDLYFNPADRDRFLKLLGQHRKLELFEEVIRHKNGQPVHVISNIVGIFNDRGDLVEIKGFVFDITQRKKLEDQLRQAHKMEAIGRLAGGVAHEFNNLLTVIIGYSDLILRQTKTPDTDIPFIDFVREIRKAGDRAAAVTRQLLAFGRRTIYTIVMVDVNRVLRDTKQMLRPLIGENIDLVTNLDPELGLIRFDPGQMQQIIVNLALNARDAMPNGGQLTFTTTNLTLARPHIGKFSEIPAGPYVLLTVSDTGVGMTEQVRDYLFEPFFSTKPFGKGTGLCLSTMYGNITQGEGHIEVSSTPGQGTTFQIYMPRAD